MALRKNYRIIGNLVGSSLINSRNFSHKGMYVTDNALRRLCQNYVLIYRSASNFKSF